MEITEPAVASRDLTDYERRLLRHVAAGGTNPSIARRLSTTTCTVQSALACVYRKLGARNRAHAVAIAVHNGWITLDHVTPAREP
ncbi:response regulator transcription factor [Kitasatospora fiedleri]|uniref:response regulator transcription factor n=1 Tax=Kitasatospora fiedleri TaxID=2991545 RepID=UPI002499D6C5|nr:helix-turn-helix transcriptional regulator [Kitasatospora fiedleri]